MKKHYLADYQPPHYFIDSVQLEFYLSEQNTRVKSILSVRKNPFYVTVSPLELQGEELKLISVKLDNQMLKNNDYTIDSEKLIIPGIPENNFFILEIETEIDPLNNTSLSGLYISKNIFCTQCEAHGFRRITFFMDRPDVMSVYTTKIIADKNNYPILLSNGNLIDTEDSMTNNRHSATWHDPFPKPCYLFALVAGDLAVSKDKFVTENNREVALNLYVEKGNEDKCEHAIRSLKKAMRWDEEKYGREYDLDIFNIVAVSAFNMGAMENKSLNIFNDKYILAKAETATDADFEAIESVVAHEYFHNWTGNRITCRDWFQLSLKEGFTVFRDQEFSRDMNSRAVNRIKDIYALRTYQFVEDAGPTAHPVMPDSYVEIDNFYTATVYNKGAEVIRMMHTLVGDAGFRRGTDLYFSRYDGQAVTIEELICSIEEANQIDLQQFRRWYHQAGTPQLTISAEYDAKAATYSLSVTQTCPPTPEQKEKKPFHIPLKIALLSVDGNIIQSEKILEIKQDTQQFVFNDINTQPIPSLLRDFSAPVKLNFEYSDEDLIFLLKHDTNGVSQWEAGQQLIRRVIKQLITAIQRKQKLAVPSTLIEAYRIILQNEKIDLNLRAELLIIPSENALLSELISVSDQIVDVDALCAARKFLINALAKELQSEFTKYYRLYQQETRQTDAAAIAARKMKNLCLSYLAMLETVETTELVLQQFSNAKNMTDEIAALSNIVDLNSASTAKAEILEKFYRKWSADDLVLDKWFAVQAKAKTTDALEQVKNLIQHPKFNIKNPNKVRSLIGVFSNENIINFHHVSGAGYEFLANQIQQLDAINPQIAARLLTPLLRWKKFDLARQNLMKQQLTKLKQTPNLSKDVGELLDKSLQ